MVERRLKWPILRDALQWVAGIGIIGHQVFIARAPNWELLMVAMILMGIPGAIALSHLKPGGKNETQPGPEQQSISPLP